MTRFWKLFIRPFAWVLGLDRASARVVWGRIIIAIVPVAALIGGASALLVNSWNDGFDKVEVPAPNPRASAGSAGTETPDQSRGKDVQATPVVSPTKSASKTDRADAKEPWFVSLAGKIAWPLALIFSVLLFIFSRSLRNFFGAGAKAIRTIKAGGIEMELDAQKFDEIRDHLRSSFRELIADAKDEYERMADLQDVREKLANVFDKVIKPSCAGGQVPADLRATVHVRDVIIREFLYQLVDYVPKGGGAHRRFSQRYGMIGRTWRSGMSQGTGNAFHGQISEEALVNEWGMTKEEAHGMLNSKHSCLSVLLRTSSGSVSGILYVDTDGRDAFGNDRSASAYAVSLEGKAEVQALADAVERTMAPLKASAPNLDIKDFA